MPMLGLYFGSVTIDLKRSQHRGSRPETLFFLQMMGKISRRKKQSAKKHIQRSRCPLLSR